MLGLLYVWTVSPLLLDLLRFIIVGHEVHFVATVTHIVTGAERSKRLLLLIQSLLPDVFLVLKKLCNVFHDHSILAVNDVDIAVVVCDIGFSVAFVYSEDSYL